MIISARYLEPRIITQECECCQEWIDQKELAWDLDEDRLICIDCYNLKTTSKLKEESNE